MQEETPNNTNQTNQALPNMGDLYNEAKLRHPIKDIKEKDALIPAFLQVRGLQKQHIDSFNAMIDYELKNIIMAKNNNILLTDADPNFYLRYTDIKVGKPVNDIDNQELYPHECNNLEKE